MQGKNSEVIKKFSIEVWSYFCSLYQILEPNRNFDARRYHKKGQLFWTWSPKMDTYHA